MVEVPKLRSCYSMAIVIVAGGCWGSSWEPPTMADESTGVVLTGESTDGPASDTESAEPVCDLDECDSHCFWDLDECGQHLQGACTTEDECTCFEDPCLPCNDEDCGRWEHCSGLRLGICEFPCRGAGSIWIDPAGSCEVPLHDFPFILLGYTSVVLDGEAHDDVDDCIDEPANGAWTLLPNSSTLFLCDALCLEFEQAMIAELEWGCGGGP
jgi:hypothetical protein